MTSKELKSLSHKKLLKLLIEQRAMLSQTQAEIEDTKEKPKRRFAVNMSLKLKRARIAISSWLKQRFRAVKKPRMLLCCQLC